MRPVLRFIPFALTLFAVPLVPISSPHPARGPGWSEAAADPCPPDTMAPMLRARLGLPYDWCGTQEVWEQKARRMPGPVIDATCPTQGSCDDPGTRDGTPVTPLTVEVIVHVIRNNDGSGGVSQATVDATVAQMNADYAANGSGIQFHLFATRYHNNSTLACIAACGFDCAAAVADIDAMKNLYAETPAEACNIYISCQDPGTMGTLLGLGNFPWDPDALGTLGGIWLNSVATGAGEHVITHEMGHDLGLWHTHHGVTEVTACGVCYEFASGFEGNLRGDYCADTPPTSRNFNCFDPSDCDCTLAHWPPTQPQNYMGYAPASCVTTFTTQQVRRLQCWTKARLLTWTDGVPPALSLHVQDQHVIRVASNGNRWLGRDTILIADQSNQPLPGASVTAVYTGPNSGTLTGATGANGRVVLSTPLKKSPAGEWCFEVTSVSKSGYAYNPGANVVTKECESGPVFLVAGPRDLALHSPGGAETPFLRVRPNPVAGSAWIDFRLAREGSVELDVFDLVGRRVRRIESGHRAAGEHSIAFERRSDGGAALAPGMYVCRLRTGDGQVVRSFYLVSR